MPLFLQPVNDHFSWCLPQILLTFCHRAARNHLSSLRRKQQRQTDNLMLILVLVQSGAGLRKQGLTQPTVQLYVTPGCLYCSWNVHVKPKDSWMLYVLYCEFFVLQKTKLRAMLDKVPRLSRDIPLAFSALESTRAARCPCLLISLSQRERSEILTVLERLRAEAELLPRTIVPPATWSPHQYENECVYFPSVGEIRALVKFLSTITWSSYFRASLMIAVQRLCQGTSERLERINVLLKNRRSQLGELHVSQSFFTHVLELSHIEQARLIGVAN